MAETETTAVEKGGMVHDWRSSFYGWAIGLSGRDKILIFWVPILILMFILIFPPTFEAWINHIEPKVVWIPWSIFATHALLVVVGLWLFVLQRVDNAQAVERGEI